MDRLKPLTRITLVSYKETVKSKTHINLSKYQIKLSQVTGDSYLPVYNRVTKLEIRETTL